MSSRLSYSIRLKRKTLDAALAVGIDIQEIRRRLAPRALSLRDDRAILCNFCGDIFKFTGNPHPEGMLCPHCRAIGREHMLYHCMLLELNRRFGFQMPFVSGNEQLKTFHLLEFSPRKSRHRQNIYRQSFGSYTTSDYEEEDHLGDVRIDLTDSKTVEKYRGKFDIVLFAHVLEHIPDFRAAIRNLRTLLSPRGFCILQVPILEARYRKVDWDEFHGDNTRVFHRFGFDLAKDLQDAFPRTTLVLTRRLTEAKFPEVVTDKYSELDQISDLEILEAGDHTAKIFGFGPAEMADAFILSDS